MRPGNRDGQQADASHTSAEAIPRCSARYSAGWSNITEITQGRPCSIAPNAWTIRHSVIRTLSFCGCPERVLKHVLSERERTTMMQRMQPHFSGPAGPTRPTDKDPMQFG